jgi:hypothetical protein
VRNLSSIDIDSFKRDLNTRLSEHHNVDQMFLILKDTLDKHAPASQRRIRDRSSCSWYNCIGPELREAKRQRRQAERKWRRTGLVIDRQLYQAARNRVTELVHNAKSSFYSSKISNCETTKQLYKVTNALLGKSQDHTSPSPSTFPSSNLAQSFSEFFIEKIDALRLDLEDDSSNTTHAFDFDKSFHGNSLTCFHSVTVEMVKKFCYQTAPKTCILDPLPTSLLLECLDVLAPHITSIFNTALTSGTFPSVFKSAVVRPILKKSGLDPDSLHNYRPISTLSFLSKVLEKIVSSQLLTHLIDNNLLIENQSAYRSNHSTETALLKVVNDLLVSMDKGEISLLSLLDLSSAFDTVDIPILLTRLECSFGISDTALSLIRSFLSGREQKVCINNCLSDSSTLKFGVPQGSVLGPILFVLYVSPVSNVINAHCLSHQCYADDTQIYAAASASEINVLVSKVQKCLSDLKTWMTHNKLHLNENKTDFMFIIPKKYVNSACIPTSIAFNSSVLPVSTCARNLGVYFDTRLSFDKQVSNVCRLANFDLRRISSIRHYLTTEATKTLVCSFVLSRLDYCNSLFPRLMQYQLDRLQKIQNHAARLVLRVSKRESASPLLNSLHWLPVRQRIRYKLSSLCYASLNGSAPRYIADLIRPYSTTRELRSSSQGKLHLPDFKLKTAGERSFAYTAPKVWNDLPVPLRFASSLSSFKSSLKTYLFKNT